MPAGGPLVILYTGCRPWTSAGPTRCARRSTATSRPSSSPGASPPGRRLSEPLLAKELGVSRTPVREALMRLSEEGLVELVPGKGARVRAFTPEEVDEVYGVRALLEGEAAREAALRATPWELSQLEELLKSHRRGPQGGLPRADAPGPGVPPGPGAPIWEPDPPPPLRGPSRHPGPGPERRAHAFPGRGHPGSTGPSWRP